MIRHSLISALTGAIVLGTAWAGVASAAHPAAHPGAHPAAASLPGAAGRPAGGPAPLVPRATGVALSAAALAAAADRCAAWASQSGFADNGYLTGSLTSAVAMALAESSCNPAACYDDTTGATCAKHVPPGDSVDRGAWQLNSKNHDGVTVKCAFSGPCSARNAYTSISRHGTYFSRWATYLTDIYARFLPAAQVAVNALTAGTVTSGLPGSCLGYPSDTAAATLTVENCGSGAADEQWTVVRSTLRTGGGLCLTAASRSQSGPVVLAACTSSALQRWVAHAYAALYNPASRRCLTDPGAAVTPGAMIVDSGCNGRPDQTWFKP